jgi:PKD repeat protein
MKHSIKLMLVITCLMLMSPMVLALPSPVFDAYSTNEYLNVQFSDITGGNPVAWRWCFGDERAPGSFSTIQRPNFTYSRPGNYYVGLIVWDSEGHHRWTSKWITVPVPSIEFVPPLLD